jgi:hypothetical protein
LDRGAKPLPANSRWIEVLAVVPGAVAPDGFIRNVLLCRTDAGLQRLDERQEWEALQAGQYRDGRGWGSSPKELFGALTGLIGSER